MRFIANLLVGMMVILAALAFSSPAADAAPGEVIIINEIMYDSLSIELEGEWVELHNPTTQAVNMNNWSLLDQDGDDLLAGIVDFTFPDLDFPAGGYALIHTGQGTNSTAFVNGKADFFMWKSTSIWSPTGDDCLLTNGTGSSIDFVSYGQWNGTSTDSLPVDIIRIHTNASAEEGFTVALSDGQFKESVPTPLESNGHDIAPALLITEVYYDTWGENEYAVIYNPTANLVNISYWYFTDGDGVVVFPSGTVIDPAKTLIVAQNSTNYQAAVLDVPDFEYYNIDSNIQDMIIMDYEPSLANDKGQALLFNSFRTQIDAFVYGDSDYDGGGWDSEPAPDLKQGKIAKRQFNGTYVDTNISADWLSLRPYVIGQSSFQSPIFSGISPMWLFSSPDSSFDAISEALDNATQSICLNLYEFINTRLADQLLDAISRGADVRLFLEGSPVGGMNETQLYIARQIVEAGGSVRILTNDHDNDIHARYDFNHGKYAVIDDKILLIMSENWGWTGVPLTGQFGNRGWGAAISDTGLAEYFKDVFEEDWNPLRADSVSFDSDHEKWNDGHNWSREGTESPSHFNSRYVISQSQITPVISPDTSLSDQTILGMLESAQERICVEEFYIYKHWGDRATGTITETPNLYLEAVIDAARRGCEVRILLDSTYYNIESGDPIDNDDTVEYVNEIAIAEDLDMEAKLVNLVEHDFVKIHNKGMIVDDKVLISSINWNLNSATANRETGVIIQNQEAANFFTDIFDYDWKDDTTPPYAHFSYEPAYQINSTVQFNSNTSFDNVGIVNYTWSLDDQPLSRDANLTHNFTQAGLCRLNLTVEDAWNNKGWVEHTINITISETDGVLDDGSGTDNTNETSDLPSDDNSIARTVAVLLLVPLFIFIAVVYVLRIRNR